MLNTGRVCHGGFIFFLADNAFAYACLSSNRLGATLSAHIMYTQGAKLGERLTATAQMISVSVYYLSYFTYWLFIIIGKKVWISKGGAELASTSKRGNVPKNSS